MKKNSTSKKLVNQVGDGYFFFIYKHFYDDFQSLNEFILFYVENENEPKDYISIFVDDFSMFEL